eukprot:354715-Chlamydomonas_euryale.AAC.3
MAMPTASCTHELCTGLVEGQRGPSGEDEWERGGGRGVRGRLQLRHCVDMVWKSAPAHARPSAAASFAAAAASTMSWLPMG